MEKRSTLSLALVLVLTTAAHAQENWVEARAELFERTIPRVEKLARSCQTWRLYAERDLLYEALIQLDADHGHARRCLGFKRTKQGWRQRSYRDPKNLDRARFEEYAQLRKELAADWKQELLSTAERFDLDREQEESLLDDLLILTPDDPGARRQRGEERDASGAWVLSETIRARQRRAELETGARAIREAPLSFEPAGDEPDSPLDWKQELRSSYGQLRATCGGIQAFELLGALERMGQLFELTFGEVPSVPTELTIYLLEGSREKHEFLARHPRADDRLRASASLAGGIWFDEGSALVFWTMRGRESIEQVLCQGLDGMLRRSFGLDVHRTWARVGFGLRLCELATGGAMLVAPDAPPGAEWHWKKNEDLWGSVRELAERDELPSLEGLLEHSGRDLDRSQTLLAYAFARYLLESHAADAGRFLDDLGHGDVPLERCLERILGHDGAHLEQRLRRWICEVD